MIPQNLLPLANHLWQSTVFTGAAALLAIALRRNRAQTRFWVWLAASVKFLIPFSLLIGLGRHWEMPQSSFAATPVPGAAAQFVQPFASTSLAFGVSMPGARGLPAIETALIALWACGCLAILLRWIFQWMRIRRTARRALPLDMHASVPVLSSADLMEPGVFGIVSPVLLLPNGIAERLAPEQLAAILAHELCHVRRRDNLTAAIHMAIQAVFWFHPLVWWLGARLVEERERACDEEVVRLGSRPETYAEGILNVCRYCLESPLPCVAGVTGADLKKRIEAIMTARLSHRLSAARKLLLAMAGMAAIAGPIAIGVLHTPQGRAQATDSGKKPLEFEVASIKPSNADERNTMINFAPGGVFRAKNAPLKQLIALAYSVHEFQISGGPGWIGSDRFDIEAKPEHTADPPDFRSMTDEQRNALEKQFKERVRSLLADRFQLKVREETKEMPVYALVEAKGGSKLQPSKTETGGNRGIRMNRGVMNGMGAPVDMLAKGLSDVTGRPVIDKTGLAGTFDWKLEWTPDQGSMKPGLTGEKRDPANPPDLSGPSIFTAIQDQLGLKLEAQKAAAPFLVIEQVEKPSAN